MLDLVVLAPTRHEAANVGVLAERVVATLDSSRLTWRLIFIDDSDDETVAVLDGLAALSPGIDVLHRPDGGRGGGLAGAVLAGLSVTQSRWVAVMDADLQHPPDMLANLLDPLMRGRADVVVGSRFAAGTQAAGRRGPFRPALSAVGRVIARAAVPRARMVSDPLGGFFAFERAVVEDVAVRSEGVRFLLELLVRGRWSKVEEVPYTLAARARGRSKAGVGEGWRFLRQIWRLRLDGGRPEVIGAARPADSSVVVAR